MLHIKHKTNGHTEKVEYPQWRDKYNHDLWEILEFNDIVKLYQWRKNKKDTGQIVELFHAKDKVNQSPNEFSYEPMSLIDYYVFLGKQQYFHVLKDKINGAVDAKIDKITNDNLLNKKSLETGSIVKKPVDSIESSTSKRKKLLDFLSNPDTKTVFQTTVWGITIISALIAFIKWILPYLVSNLK